MNVDAFDLPGPWLDAFYTILNLIETGNVDPRLEELPLGPCSDRGIESYSRAICEANPRSNLGIAYGLSAVATAVAAQGGIVLECPVAGGGWLRVPAIQHFIGVAPSGWRKSTALAIAQEPLQHALSAGVRWRLDASKKLLAEAKNLVLESVSGTLEGVDPDWRLEPKQFAEVFNSGACLHTIVKDPTVEALRNMAVHMGGTVAALAGEADIFRNVSAYSKDPGSLTFFLDLWDQSSIATARVNSGMLEMDNAALNLGVLFQTDVFAEVTSGSGGRAGSGADNFISRGMFGRIWVVAANETGGFTDIAATYADEVEHARADADADGYVSPDGTISKVGLALMDYSAALNRLVNRTNEYRMYKALHHSWARLVANSSTDVQVPEIEQLPRHVLRLPDTAAITAYNRVQRLYNALEHALSGLDEDAKIQNGPLVSRFVQHTMREALIVALSSGSDEVTAEIITDCATRIIPWRWALSTRALLDRSRDRIESIVMANSWENPKADDRTMHGRVRQVMTRMAMDDPIGAEDGWTVTDIVKKFTATMQRNQRTGMKNEVTRALDELVADSKSGITRKTVGRNPVNGAPVHRFRISPATYATNV